MKSLGLAFVAVVFLGAVFLVGAVDKKITTGGDGLLASVFFVPSVTSSDLRATFEATPSAKKKINVLIVPGHEPDFGGTEYVNIKERDLVVDLGFKLAQYLVEDGHYNVTLTRGNDGWNPIFETYFTEHEEEIKTFVISQKREMSRLVEEGKVTAKEDNLPHNDAPSDVALRLYGINKWANENNIDIVLHLHFNDSYPRRVNAPGEYSGLAVYTPERQYSNAQASKELAQYVFKRLTRMFPVSNLPQEDQGVVEDQKLIATGSYNTVDVVSILLEYGYIYEPQLQVSSVRSLVLKELAFQTYLGLSDFFGESPFLVDVHESTLLPYDVSGVVKKNKTASVGALKLQATLLNKGFYPPQNYTKNDCPLSGVSGLCTRTALIDFQNKFNIKGEDGIVGTKTRAQLRKLFEPDVVGVLR